jgi:molybdate transport system ATP-binding protein
MLAVHIEARVGELDLVIDLPPHPGTTVVIGPNGAGKSSLLLALLGAIRPSRGEIRLGDTVLFCADKKISVPIEDRRLGYVPQRYALFPHMTVATNVAYGIGGDGAARRDRARQLLGELGVGHLADRRTSRLSGGESQRVALARAMAISPRALLLDEPMAALDAGARRKVRRFLAARLAAFAVPTVVVSHDIDDAVGLGGRIAVLERGRIAQIGDIDELRAAPATPFVADFLGAGPNGDGVSDDTEALEQPVEHARVRAR